MPQLDIFWINVELKFKEGTPIQGFDLSKNGYAKGIIMNFGITAENEEIAREMVESNLKEDLDLSDISYDLEFSNVGVIEPKDVDKEIYGDIEIADSLIHSPHDEGLWYRSGKAYYKD